MKCECGSENFVPIGFTVGEDKDLVFFNRKRIASVALNACLDCGRVYLNEEDLQLLRAADEEDKLIKEIQAQNKAKKKNAI